MHALVNFLPLSCVTFALFSATNKSRENIGGENVGKISD